jgi:xylulokinase
MTKQQYLMGIDIGTTTSKGVIVTPQGKIVASAGFEHNISSPFLGWAEHDAEKVWWGDFVAVCRQLLEISKIDPREIVAVSHSTLYPTLVPVDNKGVPLRPGILYGVDRRAIAEIEALKKELTEEYCIQISGNGLTTQSIAPKILWIKNNEPDVFAATHKYLNASAYITLRLTGKLCIDHGSASLGGVPYRVKTGDWDEATINACGITRDKLPELVWADENIGCITPEAAAETGLSEGTAVAPGTGDHVTESLSQGYIQSGAASVSYGTTFGMDVCTDKPLICPGISLCRSCFKDIFMIGGGMLNGCSLTRWFRDNLASFDEEIKNKDDFDPYTLLNEDARTVAAGCDGLIALPYFAGEKIPFFDAGAKGVLFGLRLQHTRKHIYRALLESVAFSVRHTLECVENAGFSVRQVISTGGGTRSDVWTQIVSDVTGLRQQVLKQSHGSPMGAAFLGALVSGVITDRNKILEWNELDRWVEPNPGAKGLYDGRYKVYRQLYANTKELMQLI